MLRSITYFSRCNAVPALKCFTFSVQYQYKKHIYCKMAEDYTKGDTLLVLKHTQYSVHYRGRLLNLVMAVAFDKILTNTIVRRFFVYYIEPNESLTDSLWCKNLISDNQREQILKENASNKPVTCYEILVQNEFDGMIPILNSILKEKGYNTIEDIILENRPKPDSLISFGNTIPLPIPLPNLHMATLHLSDERSADQMNRTPVDEINALVLASDGKIVLYHTQPGCIHIFLHSKEPFYKDMCNAENCRVYIEKCLTLRNVKETLKPNQTLRIVIKKNAFSLPLHDEKGKSLEFSKMMVLKINRYYINRELNQCTQIFEKLEPVTGRLPQSQYKLADILLDLMKDDPVKVWQTLICSLREVENHIVADRLERMTCAECYRRTIICDFKNIVDEIDTDLMEETFEGKPYIPEVVSQDCILSKGKLPRVERAKYFLEYVLLKGEVLLSFADAFSSRSKVVLNFSPCEAHGGESLDTSSSEPDKEFTFLVCKDEKDRFYLKRFQTPSEGETLSNDRLNDGVNGGNGVHIEIKKPLKRSEQTDSDAERKISIKKEKIHEHDEPTEIIKGAQA